MNLSRLLAVVSLLLFPACHSPGPEPHGDDFAASRGLHEPGQDASVDGENIVVANVECEVIVRRKGVPNAMEAEYKFNADGSVTATLRVDSLEPPKRFDVYLPVLDGANVKWERILKGDAVNEHVDLNVGIIPDSLRPSASSVSRVKVNVPTDSYYVPVSLLNRDRNPKGEGWLSPVAMENTQDVGVFWLARGRCGVPIYVVHRK